MWPTFKNKPKTESIFSFIINSGVIDIIADLGFNTIQFLPVSQSIDGDNWKYRFLSPFPFALQKNWGNPDEFRNLVDEFHKRGIAVILDIILSHVPFKNFKLFDMAGEDVGIHRWIKYDSSKKSSKKEQIFLGEETEWGTKRYRYEDSLIRRFGVESALHFMTRFGVDGFRVDNVDGILRRGPNGQGDDRPGGRLFLRELAKEIYRIDSSAILNYEAHYFYGGNARLLVAPIDFSNKALGATAYSSSRLTYYFHTVLMPKSADDLSVKKLEDISREKVEGESNSTIADFHNHDAAAGLMAGRATGSYAYDALILGDEKLHFHAIGKIKIMSAFISFFTEGRTLDLLQSFLLQKGSFEHNSSIDWGLFFETNYKSKTLINFKKEINKLMDRPAFWPENTLFRECVFVDDSRKILVVKREDRTQNTKEKYYVLINFSSKTSPSIKFPVTSGDYEVVFDDFTQQTNKTPNSEYLSRIFTSKKDSSGEWDFLELPKVNPYNIIVLKKSN